MALPATDALDTGKLISTKSAKIFIQRDGKNIPLAECTDFKAKVKKNKETIKTLGKFSTGHKFVGWEGTGSISGYLINSELISSELEGLKTGVDPVFNVVATYYGDDEQGNQTLLYKSVSLDDVDFGELKSDDGVIKFESDLTFDDVDLVDAFK